MRKSKSKKAVDGVRLTTDELYAKALKQVKDTGDEWLKLAHEEAVIFRLASDMDEKGHFVKPVEIDEVTGLVIKKKRGRKPKAKVEAVEEKEISTKKITKKIAKKKPAKKKEKGQGRQPSAPVLQFTATTLVKKVKLFDEAMNNCFGKKYNGKNLTVDKAKLIVEKSLTRPTKKNPDGVLLVTIANTKRIAKFYEWDKRFWMAQVVNFPHYMKPIKK